MKKINEKHVPITIYVPVDTLLKIKTSKKVLMYGFNNLMNFLIDIGMEEMGIIDETDENI